MIIKQIKGCRNYTKGKKENLLIVIHWACCTGRQCINWFLNKGCRASAHYVIDRFGNIFQLIDEKNIAWHAGYSSLKDYPTKLGKVDWQSLNVCSIGIELSGPPTDINEIIKRNKWTMPLWIGWPDQEIDALIQLCKEIKIRYPGIKLTDHSTIAPRRKSDVKGRGGIDKFPWEKLLNETRIQEA